MWPYIFLKCSAGETDSKYIWIREYRYLSPSIFLKYNLWHFCLTHREEEVRPYRIQLMLYPESSSESIPGFMPVAPFFLPKVPFPFYFFYTEIV